MSRRIRVLHIINSLRPGGAEAMLLKLVSALPRDEFDLSVLTLLDGGRLSESLSDLNVWTGSLDLRPVTILRAAASLKAHVRGTAPDVLHGWMPHGNVTAWLARKLASHRPAVIWGIRQALYTIRTQRPVTAGLIRFGAIVSGSIDRIIYNSSEAQRHHLSIGYDAERALVIPNGFDCGQFRPDPAARALIREELGIPADVPLVGHIARFHPMKDHAAFLRAAAAIAETHPRVEFLLAGAGVTSDQPALREILDHLPSLVGRVHLIGDRADVARIHAALDIACLSSWTEAFPNILGEAMATGVPCVSTDVGEARAIVGETGIIVPARDPAALGQALLAVVRLSDEERRRLGARARERILERYTLARVAATYADVYRELAADRQRRTPSGRRSPAPAFSAPAS